MRNGGNLKFLLISGNPSGNDGCLFGLTLFLYLIVGDLMMNNALDT